MEYTAKQKMLLSIGDVDTILYGGARGGGKSFGSSAAMALEIVEWYSEEEAKKAGINTLEYRNTSQSDKINGVFYYKMLIDYPEYEGVFVRRTEDALLNQTHSECKKIYPHYGGRWSNRMWTFPSGATLTYRPCNRAEHLDWFQGQNKHRLCIEELTQFDQDEVDEMEACCRSAHKYIKAKKIYTTNPGKRGHKWVYDKIVRNCTPQNDGEPVYLPEYDLTYQPLKPGPVYINKFGERYLYIPALVFDNEHLSERDKNYVRNLMGKNEILKEMWLFGNWDVFAGQFFSMWREEVHVRSELEFFGASDYVELISKRRNFDWGDYRLYISNDYGFAEKSAWACGIYAVHNDTNDRVKIAEIVKSGLTIHQQARETKDFIKSRYNLEPDDIELWVADPKSYWQRQEKNENEFWTFAKAYEEEGIILTKGINDRMQGAMAFIEALRVREDGTPTMTFLDCCVETIESIPNLPADPKNPNDVDSTVFDHPYDEGRYFLMCIIGEAPEKVDKKRTPANDFRQRLKQVALGTYEGKPKSWRVA